MKKYLLSLVLCAFVVPALAQEPDPRPFCNPADCQPDVECCSDDLMEIRFVDDAGALGFRFAAPSQGDTIKVAFIIDTTSDMIQGWSYAAKHDDEFLSLTEVSEEGADFLAVFSGGFKVTGPGFGGPDRDIPDQGIGQAVVLSFVEPKVLPVQDDITLAFATYDVTKAPAMGESTLIEYADDELATASGGPAVEINLTVQGETKRPTQLADAIVLGPQPVECDNWAFYFGDDPEVADLDVTGNSFVISLRNIKDAAAFELAVKNDNNNLTFVADEIGDGEDNLRDLVITDVDGLSQTDLALNTASIPDLPITSGERIGVTVEEDGDFFVVQTQPLVGEGFFAGYVADLTNQQDHVIPATPAEEPCPVNLILKMNLGGDVRPQFSRGDVNGDERINVTDGVLIVHQLFGVASSEDQRIDCQIAWDVNDDSAVGIEDAMFLLNWIFRRGDRPEDPFLTCGTDDEDDDLPCAVSNCQ